jgi:hypothetical protein
LSQAQPDPLTDYNAFYKQIADTRAAPTRRTSVRRPSATRTVTIKLPLTAYFTDEFGAFSAAAAVIVAVVFRVRRRELPEPDNAI